mgnify:CR=1 FL=1
MWQKESSSSKLNAYFFKQCIQYDRLSLQGRKTLGSQHPVTNFKKLPSMPWEGWNNKCNAWNLPSIYIIGYNQMLTLFQWE